MLIAVGDNPHRLGNESQFASLLGVAPLPAPSGKTPRRRLSRCRDRSQQRPAPGCPGPYGPVPPGPRSACSSARPWLGQTRKHALPPTADRSVMAAWRPKTNCSSSKR
ncbi:transposase [Pseudarthrobacter sp. fls2-241-R2A-127]|uniref:transposase n=1 Tax=Pseudarthrobacter sp. fls2-241-R2A-127 TaxID=3040303 RepID=UPI003306825F